MTLSAHASVWCAMVRKIRADEGGEDISAPQGQEAWFFGRFESSLSSDQRKLVRGFSTLQRRKSIARRLFLVRHCVLRDRMARNLVLLFRVRTAKDAR